MSTPEIRPELADKGAHFYRTDIQVHTPRDTQWDGTRPTDEAGRQAYAAEFVRQCRQRGLHAVAITDHHDFCYFPYIHAAAQTELSESGQQYDEKDRLVVFPGLELTLNVPCQALLILDADFPHDRLPDILKALHFDPIDPSMDSIPQTTPLDDSGDLGLLHEKLDKHAWLRGRYIILPNVTPSGYKTLLRQSFQSKYNDMPCIGGYLDGDVSLFKKKVGERLILEGRDRAWGNKRLALFQTSDSRSHEFTKLGQVATWVKWSNPTAEALRQACLAQESRITQDEPALPNVWISRVLVSNSKFLGRVDVNLNPQYTALIGGRGTGKSTLLDYLRWALCDQPAHAGDDEVADPRVRQRNLIAATLVPLDSQVEVHCTINGIPHIVRRYAQSGDVHLRVGDGTFEKVREAVIQSLLPIQAYSQKQLSSVAIRLEELIRFVTSPIQKQLEDIDRKSNEASGRLRENYGTLQRFRALVHDIERSRVRIASLAEQAQALRNSLGGLSDDDRATLDSKSAYDETKAVSAQWKQHVSGIDTALDGLLTVAVEVGSQLQLPPGIPDALHDEAEILLRNIQHAVDTVRTSVSASKEALVMQLANEGGIASASAALDAKLRQYEDDYAGVKLRSTAHEGKLRELASLEDQQRAARELLQKQEQNLGQLGDPASRHAELRLELSALNRERSHTLAIQCSQLSESSDGLIRATLAIGQGFGTIQEKFKGLIAGSSVRGSKIENFFEQLAAESDPVGSWENVLSELEKLTLLDSDEDIRSEDTPILTRLGLTTSDQKKIAKRLSPEGWLDLSLNPLADHPKFEYRSKEDVYIPFGAASAGQQATALLTTLLSQDGLPLVVDQPEDDLDSDTVQHIVTKIWKSKSRRQLIFSSHNANLVVNGDADLVLVCAYASAGDQSSGHIKTAGAIDGNRVREEITSIMEGGEKAFRLRKEKYGF